MKDCSLSRQLPALTHDALADSVAERPLPEVTISRIAENAAHYLPTSEWERDVMELNALLEAHYHG